MNLKSFPGPQSHIRVGGVVVMLRETRGRRGWFAARHLGGPYVPMLRGPLPQRFPRLVLLVEQWGQGAPAACYPLPFCSTQSGQEGCW